MAWRVEKLVPFRRDLNLLDDPGDLVPTPS
jgi:hypothetical protein